MPSKKNIIKLYVSDIEMQVIMQNAKKASLSLSTFGKKVCLGYEINSKIDSQAVLDLIKVNADLGRLGGLLKLWLTTPDKNEFEVRKLLKALESLKTDLEAKISQL